MPPGKGTRPLRKSTAPGNPFKTGEIIGNGHGHGQQLLEGLGWFLEIYRDSSRLEANAGGKVFEILAGNRAGRFHQQLRPRQPLILQLNQNAGQSPAPPLFIVAVIADGDLSQARNEGISISQAIAAHVVGHARREDLLGAAAADPQQDFDRRAVHERAGKALQLPHDSVEFAVPARFSRHLNQVC